MNRFILILALLSLTLSGVNAQITATAGESASDEAREARKSQLALERKLDLFNPRYFKPFVFAEVNYGVFGSFSKDEAYTVTAPVSLGLGYRISPLWSVGVRAGQSVYNSDAYYYDRTFETRIQTRLRVANVYANAHFPLGIRGEAYGGFNIGYQDTDITAMEESPKSGEDRTIVRPQQGFLYSGQLGIRYSLAPQISIQSEFTTGLSNFNVGVQVRLR